MFKKMTLIVALALFVSMSFAETCPSVEDVKNNHINGWKLYDSEDNTPLSAKREADFKKNISQFSLAEWTDIRKNHGTIHCYYHDSNGSDFEAYLVKENFNTPREGKNYWYKVTGSMHCSAGTAQCEFQRVLPSTQLAKR